MEFEQHVVKEHKSTPEPATPTDSDCFDCIICLNFAREPVLTLCGHLYCWPCIYKWFDSSNEQPHQCPLCKSQISLNTMIPIYGRGQSVSEPESQDKPIPPRPRACDILGFSSYVQSMHNHTNRDDHSEPMVFGEMVYARVFGNSQSLFTYPNSYQSVSSSSRILRRREMEADKSLNRVAVFLFCCIVLCLLVF